MHPRYRHLFFDLDHTLWDFEGNTALALAQLVESHDLLRWAPSAEAFINVYRGVNDRLWADLRNGRTSKEHMRMERFEQTMAHFDCRDAALAKALSSAYLEHAPRLPGLMPGAKDVLETLKDRYALHILTNGFPESQSTKLEAAGIAGLFDHVITSEDAGAHKPSAKMFVHAMQVAGASRRNSLMIGDHPLVDVAGARNVGMDQVWFNPANEASAIKPTFEIRDLKELLRFL